MYMYLCEKLKFLIQHINTYYICLSHQVQCSTRVFMLTLNKTLSHNFGSGACVRRMRTWWRRNGTFLHHRPLSSDPRPLDLVDQLRSSCTLDLCPRLQTLYGDPWTHERKKTSINCLALFKINIQYMYMYIRN